MRPLHKAAASCLIAAFTNWCVWQLIQALQENAQLQAVALVAFFEGVIVARGCRLLFAADFNSSFS
jgi:hypothetical protein